MRKENRDIAIAAGAVLFISAAMPIIGSIVDIIQSVINAKIGRMQMALELDQCEHEAAAEIIHPQSNPTNAIGFNIHDESDMEDDEE